MKTMDILGITFKYYSLRESLRLTEQYMKTGPLSTVVCVSKKQLIEAADHAELKEWVEHADLTVFCDPDILETEKNISRTRLKEAENQEYVHEFLKRAVKTRSKIFLLSDSKEQVDLLRETLFGRQGSLNIAGEGVLQGQEETEADSTLVNEINSVAPRVIIARLPFTELCSFVERNRRFINAGLLLGLPQEGILAAEPRGFFKLTGYAYRKIFRHRVKKYNHQEKTE
ncbi:MAG: hypothetical protein J6B10_04075 [Lachnospiraceae bacterium]|nr:hypothetical protein [Lachnospiraceae bacterium]